MPERQSIFKIYGVIYLMELKYMTSNSCKRINDRKNKAARTSRSSKARSNKRKPSVDFANSCVFPKEAINSFKDNQCKGILSMATGLEKTKTRLVVWLRHEN